MSRTPPDVIVRGYTAAEVAAVLGLSHKHFLSLRRELVERGFPLPHDITKKYDIKAVHAFLDRESGLEEQSPGDDLMARILGDGQGENAVRR